MTKLEERMVKIYADLVRKNEKAIENVPENLRKSVIELLEE